MKYVPTLLLCSVAAACSGHLASIDDPMSVQAADASPSNPSADANLQGDDANDGGPHAFVDAPPIIIDATTDVTKPASQDAGKFYVGSDLQYADLMNSAVGAKVSASGVVKPGTRARVSSSNASCASLALEGSSAGAVLFEVTNVTSSTLVVDVDVDATGTTSLPDLFVADTTYPFYLSDVISPGYCSRVSVGSGATPPAFKKSKGTSITLPKLASVYIYAQDAAAANSYYLTLQFTVAAVL